MKTLNDYREAGQGLYDKLHLSTYPIAIKYITDVAEIPQGTRRPSDKGQKWSLCQAFTYARRWGWSVAMTSDDNFCTPSTVGQGWEDIPHEDFMQSQVLQGWHKDIEAQVRFSGASSDSREASGRPVKYRGFICSPLPETVVIPDSVLVYGTGENITHIIHALAYEGENVPTCSFSGFGESCSKGALMPFITQKPQVVIPGTGDRTFSGTYDYEIAIGLPANLLFFVIDHLLVTGGRLNMGHPVKTLLPQSITESVTPGFKYLREKIDEHKKKEGQ
jgi:uncharacterized protein (DUF169 family)